VFDMRDGGLWQANISAKFLSVLILDPSFEFLRDVEATVFVEK
jgi:hypothetical protein